MKTSFITILAILLSSPLLSHAQIKQVWKITEGLEAPESVVFDQKANFLYVSNYTRPSRNGSSYGDCFISKVSLEGQIVDKEWIGGLTSPTGLFLKDSLLYIVERFGVAVYNIRNDQMITRHRIKHEGFINDIAVDDENNIYISTSGSNVLFQIKEGQVSEWIVGDEVGDSNGFSFIDGLLYIGVNKDGYLKTIDPKTTEIANVAYIGEGNIDGIKKNGKNLIVSLYTKGLRLVDKKGNVTSLLDTESEGKHCTDFEFIPEKNLLIIPSLFDNELTAYSLK